MRLEEIADVRIVPTPNVVQRENASRRIDVEANVGGRDLRSVARDVERAIDRVDFPLGYSPALLGEFAELESTQSRILIFAIVAAIAIFFLLHTVFSSFRLATLAFLTLPAALVGGALAAYGRQRHHHARVPGGLPHGARHRDAQRDHADEALSASRGGGG